MMSPPCSMKSKYMSSSLPKSLLAEQKKTFDLYLLGKWGNPKKGKTSSHAKGKTSKMGDCEGGPQCRVSILRNDSIACPLSNVAWRL